MRRYWRIMAKAIFDGFSGDARSAKSRVRFYGGHNVRPDAQAAE
jgi:hypothetical protein